MHDTDAAPIDGPHRADPAPRVRTSAGAPRFGLVIAAAEATALLAWVAIRLAGVDPVAQRGGESVAVTTIDVVVATCVAGLAAWLVQRLLGRAGRAAWWPFVGGTALATSMIGPAYQADGASAAALILLHLVVGGVLTTGLALPRVSARAHHRGTGA